MARTDTGLGEEDVKRARAAQRLDTAPRPGSRGVELLRVGQVAQLRRTQDLLNLNNVINQ